MADLISALSPSPADAAAAPPHEEISCLAQQEGDCLDPQLAQSLRIAAVFIILVCSSFGVWLPYVMGEACLMTAFWRPLCVWIWCTSEAELTRRLGGLLSYLTIVLVSSDASSS